MKRTAGRISWCFSFLRGALERFRRKVQMPVAHVQGRSFGCLREFSNAAPLISHGGGNAGEKSRSLAPAVRARRHVMNPRSATGDDLCGDQCRQVFQPEAGSLDLAVPVL